MGIIDIALVVVGVGYLLVRRVMGDMVEIKRLLILPAVLTGIGLFSLRDVHDPGLAAVALAAAGIGVSVVLGLVRGTTIHLGNRGGELWMRYRASTVVLWLVNIAAKAALVPVAHALGGDAGSVGGSTLLLGLGLGIAAENGVVLLRAMHRDGVVVWEKGENGAAHTGSPVFDRARLRVRDGGGVSLAEALRTPTRDW